MRTYTELITLPTIKERYEYLKLGGAVGVVTFGGDRTFNQNFYSSRMWKDVRRQIIIRDHGCDLGVEGYDINNRITIHHMNPVTRDDIRNEDWEYLTNPEYLISCSYLTHQAIHYGDNILLPKTPVERTPNDTCPWR